MTENDFNKRNKKHFVFKQGLFSRIVPKPLNNFSSTTYKKNCLESKSIFLGSTKHFLIQTKLLVESTKYSIYQKISVTKIKKLF